MFAVDSVFFSLHSKYQQKIPKPVHTTGLLGQLSVGTSTVSLTDGLACQLPSHGPHAHYNSWCWQYIYSTDTCYSKTTDTEELSFIFFSCCYCLFACWLVHNFPTIKKSLSESIYFCQKWQVVTDTWTVSYKHSNTLEGNYNVKQPVCVFKSLWNSVNWVWLGAPASNQCLGDLDLGSGELWGM